MTIEIFNYRELNKGALIGSFAIRIKKWKNFCIYNLTFYANEKTKWISFPSNKVEKEGKTTYYPYCGFSEKELNDSFKSEIMNSLEEFLHSQSSKQEEVPF